MTETVAVIGGGIAGLQAALDLADAGCKVVLVERSPALGGKMAALDKNFPTLDCSICIEAPKISEAVRHPNIEVLTLAEVVGLSGHAGDFELTVEQKARFVTDACTRCDLCVAACPSVASNEFDEGLAGRKAIYTPFSQAEPGAYVIDLNACLNDPPNYVPCNRCTEACLPKCIDFGMPRTTKVTRRVASVIVATGFDLFDPRLIPEYGYGSHPDILTSLEFERLLNAAGPSSGHIVKPSNGDEPHKVAFVLCVGSRDERFCHYCSRVCCMYSLKEALQAKEHGIPEVTILFMDLRAFGKGFDEFVHRAHDEGVKMERGRPARIEAREGKLMVRVEGTSESGLREQEFDMVVLAPAMVPSRGSVSLANVLGVTLDEDGFIATLGAKGSLQRTTRDGVFVCGSASGPKDIPDSVAEASGAAASAMEHISGRFWPEAEKVEPLDTSGAARVGVFACDCGSNIAGTIKVPKLVDDASKLPGVAHAEEVQFACAAATQTKMANTLKEKGLTRCVVAACSPKTHGSTFQGVCARAGMNPYLFEMANLRNHASWVHKKDPEAATAKGWDLVKMAVEKAKLLAPLEARPQKVVQRALVVGGGVAGMSAAAAIAQQGFETHLVEKSDRLGGLANRLGYVAGMNLPSAELLQTKLAELDRAGVEVHTNTEVSLASGHVGNFHVNLTDGESLDVGAIVLATGATPHQPLPMGSVPADRVTTNLELEPRLGSVRGRNVTFLSCIGSRQGKNGCSRYCCQSMMRQALELRRQGNQVRIVSKDIRTYSRHAEELYAEAAKEGVQFFRLDVDKPVEENVLWRDGDLHFKDVLSGDRVELPTDLIVQVVGLNASPLTATAEQLKLSKGEDGFLLESHPKLAPMEAAVAGVYLAGSAQGPKDIGESIAQGLGAASKASRLLARGQTEQEPLTAQIDPNKCTGCTLCSKVCPFHAIEAEVGKPARVIEAACQGCGTCASTCPADAITMPQFTNAQVEAQIDAATADHPQEKVVVFACNWCSYAGADQAGISKIQYPPSSRIIRTMCSGRVSEKFILRAFERGAGAVLVTGCHPGSCHYLTANYETERRMARWKRRIQTKGINPERLQLAWVSAAEGKRFAEIVTGLHESVHRNGTNGSKPGGGA